jgi:hypothetical protein
MLRRLAKTGVIVITYLSRETAALNVSASSRVLKSRRSGFCIPRVGSE